MQRTPTQHFAQLILIEITKLNIHAIYNLYIK